jgi:hypothetical protein
MGRRGNGYGLRAGGEWIIGSLGRLVSVLWCGGAARVWSYLAEKEQLWSITGKKYVAEWACKAPG